MLEEGLYTKIKNEKKAKRHRKRWRLFVVMILKLSNAKTFLQKRV